MDAARATVSGPRALAAVTEVARFHRIQASPGYDAAAAWLEARLREVPGLHVERHELPADGRTRFRGAVMPEGWWCDEAWAELLADSGEAVRVADWSAAKLSLVQRSAPVDGTFEVVSAGDGTSAGDYEGLDVRGRVVLVSGNADRAHREAVVGRGAAGLLCDGRRLAPPVRTAEHDRDSLAYTSFWWQADEPRGWGFVLSPNAGAALRARLAAGERVRLRARVATRRFATTMPILTATLPGGTPGEILVTAHLCHPEPGANDNGSGVCATLECARALAALRASGELPADARTIRFLWMPELTGTFAWLGSGLARPAETVAALNLDMVGEDQSACGSTLLLEHPPHFLGSFAEELVARLRHLAQDWVKSYSGEGHYSLARLAEVPYSGGSDHAVWIDPAFGVPCPMLIQWPDRFYHSSLDTPERCDPASLSLAARVGVAYAGWLACAGAEEMRALLGITARAARRRLLQALEADDARSRAGAERLRGQMALASVARLLVGLAPGHEAVRAMERWLPLAVEELEGFFEAEILPALPPERARERASARVPVRTEAAPLEMLRHLMPGWPTAPDTVRARWRDLEARVPGGATTLDVAWYAADGRRTVDDVARLVAAEAGDVPASDVEEFFDLAAAIGASRWREGG